MSYYSDERETIISESEVDMGRKSWRNRQNRIRNSEESYSAQLYPQPFGNASQCNWFWQNYYNALEWQERHQVAYWKSRSLALEYENNLLHQYVQSLVFKDSNQQRIIKKQEPTVRANCNSRSSKKKKRRKGQNTRTQKQLPDEDEKNETSESNQDEVKFHVSKEMMQFLEQSIKHKLELKKQREEQERKRAEECEDSDDETLPPRRQIGVERNEEMKRMYGKAAPMILGMETAMQLSFDRNCDVKQPKLWPNIPLKF